MPSAQPDVDICDQGSIVLLTPLSVAAKTWFADNVDGPNWGLVTYACDHRPARDIIHGAQGEGLTFG